MIEIAKMLFFRRARRNFFRMDSENAFPRELSPALSRMPAQDRPQERLEKLGPRALQDAELLAMLLRTGTAGEDVLSVAARLVHDAGSLANLVSWEAADFAERRGIGRVKALQLLTAMEIARRVREQTKVAAPLLDKPEHVYPFFHDIVQGLETEKCWVLCLNAKLRLIRCVEITSGTAENTLVAPREAFRPALKLGASVVILAHNHPSGDPTPSAPDMRLTRQLNEAAKILEITLADHVILGTEAGDPLRRGWFSFRAAGLL